MADPLLLPFRLCLLVLLHSAFALFRLLHVLSHLPLIFRQAIFPLADPASEPALIDEDRKRWSKTPKHLAVILVPGMELRSWVWGSKADHDRRELARLRVELTKLVDWAKTLGLTSLSVYDRHGLLAHNADSLAPPLLATTEPAVARSQGCATFAVPTLATRTRRLSDLPANEADSGHGGSDDVDAGTATPPPDWSGAKAATMAVHLLSREAGRPRMAQVARELAEEELGRKEVSVKDGVTVEVVGERIDGRSGSCARPAQYGCVANATRGPPRAVDRSLTLRTRFFSS